MWPKLGITCVISTTALPFYSAGGPPVSFRSALPIRASRFLSLQVIRSPDMRCPHRATQSHTRRRGSLTLSSESRLFPAAWLGQKPNESQFLVYFSEVSAYAPALRIKKTLQGYKHFYIYLLFYLNMKVWMRSFWHNISTSNHSLSVTNAPTSPTGGPIQSRKSSRHQVKHFFFFKKKEPLNASCTLERFQ